MAFFGYFPMPAFPNSPIGRMVMNTSSIDNAAMFLKPDPSVTIAIACARPSKMPPTNAPPGLPKPPTIAAINPLIADYTDPKIFGRIFRSTNLMINVLERKTERRDPRKLSPHSHADFEQISLALEGTFVHHLRTPWSADSLTWRADQHLEVGSPSALVIPTNVIHTTQDVAQGVAWLIDIFGPPRVDFSVQPGLVRNADEYPMPVVT